MSLPSTCFRLKVRYLYKLFRKKKNKKKKHWIICFSRSHGELVRYSLKCGEAVPERFKETLALHFLEKHVQSKPNIDEKSLDDQIEPYSSKAEIFPASQINADPTAINELQTTLEDNFYGQSEEVSSTSVKDQTVVSTEQPSSSVEETEIDISAEIADRVL